jgi:GDPmannose 4,6-dehydratase
VTTSRCSKVIVAVDPRYLRPSEVETLIGDATRAKEKLGWAPRTSFPQLVKEMMDEDLIAAERDHLVKSNGFKAYDYHE